VTLYHTLKRIEVSLRILRDSTPNLELYLAFPFSVPEPRFRYEASGTVIEPLRDQMPGTATDYYAVQHWVEVQNSDLGVVWGAVDAPMVEFGGLWPGYVSGAHHGVTPPGYGHPFLRPGELKKGHIYSLLAYNNFRTNFINVHAGEALFRYAFSTRNDQQPTAWAREFGWNAANPPITVWMKGPKPGALAPSASFCQIDAPGVMLLTLKQAEDGDGFVLRLVETDGNGAEVTVTLPILRILRAYQANLVEENASPLAHTLHTVRVGMKPFSTMTIRLATG